MASLQNRSGNFVRPTLAVGAGDPWPTSNCRTTFAPGTSIPAARRITPITTFTWMLVYKTYADKAKLAALKDVLLYGVTDGQKLAPSLGYIPLPPPVVEKVKAAIETIRSSP